MLIPSCIIPYVNEDVENPNILSITGSLIKGEAVQQVEIYKTTSLNNPIPHSMEGCQVRVRDELDNEFIFTDRKQGRYTAEIPDDALVYERSYKLTVTAPSGLVYESDFETLHRNTDIDSVYWKLDQEGQAYSDEHFWGYQYYVDIVAPDTNSRYYRWDLTETYEYTSSGPLSYIIVVEENELKLVYPEYELEYYRCWATERIPGPFVTSTSNLSANEKKQIPLHFVSNRTEKLKIMYSLLVEQYALSEGAYRFWKQNGASVNETSVLFNSQPAQPITNIHCMDDPTERVLGYFWAAAKTERRIFTPRDGSLVVRDFNCEIYVYDPFEHRKKPRYIWDDSIAQILYTGEPACFDCRLRGGVLEKPDFWIH